MESKQKKGLIVEAIFKEIEECDRMLASYETRKDPLLHKIENWGRITAKEIERKKHMEFMKFNLNNHLQELVRLLDLVMQNKKIRCENCNNVISYRRLISSPTNRKCINCSLQPIPLKINNSKTNQL
ncbi:hypothetical protein LB465_06335 [Salegentibacter sp. LM13S]|uniref:hypothetical protein n=1 Tax=Salegentibacter lacus TaxID=2873599 RepID=UPI001CCFADCB|nr:hypothetical protein [Salegentibacter lacus]MBZ9630393.1 hypothetical protein [Salegentibacter lacus]